MTTYSISIRYSGRTVQNCLHLRRGCTVEELDSELKEGLALLMPSDAFQSVTGWVDETEDEQGYAGGMSVQIRASTQLSVWMWWEQAEPLLEAFEQFMNERQGMSSFWKGNRWPVEHYRIEYGPGIFSSTHDYTQLA